MENGTQDDPGTAPPPARRRRETARRAGQELACGWCGGAIAVRRTGRTPKWCSDACRHRAWEQARAAASGRAAVEVVDRQVEVEVRVPVRVREKVEVPVYPRGAQWETALGELVAQLDTGRFADRDIPSLVAGLERVNQSLRARPGFRRYYRIHWPPKPQRR